MLSIVIRICYIYNMKTNKQNKLGTGLFSRKTGHVFFMTGESSNEWCVESTSLRSSEWWSKAWVDRMISLGQFGFIDHVLDGSVEADGLVANLMTRQQIDQWFENWHRSVWQAERIA
tara:strand:+ start:1168 stop:1518 length:351 start_codon:yes stop_codon:yes gene_type:complete